MAAAFSHSAARRGLLATAVVALLGAEAALTHFGQGAVMAEGGALQSLRELNGRHESAVREALRVDLQLEQMLDTGKATLISLEPMSDAIIIKKLWGRLGDNLYQIMMAIFYAELHNVSTVQVWSKKTQGFLRLGTREPILVEPRPSAPGEMQCTRHKRTKTGPKLYPIFCQSSVENQQRVMQRYLKPRLVVSQDQFKTSDDELLIHIRSGDAMTDSMFGQHVLNEARQPPCAYYDKIIEEGNDGKVFDHVRIVTEADMQNPCIQEIKARHPDRHVVVQSKTREEDAAAIANARHVVTANSLFTKMLVLMNGDLQTLFTDEVSNAKMPCGPGKGSAKVVTLAVPELSLFRAPTLRAAWMRDYQQRNVTVKSVCQDQGPDRLKPWGMVRHS